MFLFFVVNISEARTLLKSGFALAQARMRLAHFSRYVCVAIQKTTRLSLTVERVKHRHIKYVPGDLHSIVRHGRNLEKKMNLAERAICITLSLHARTVSIYIFNLNDGYIYGQRGVPEKLLQ